MKSIIDIRVESEEIKVSIRNITKRSSCYLPQIKTVMMSKVEFNLVKFDSQKEEQKNAGMFKCFQCDYNNKTDMSLKKHVNTKQPPQNSKYFNKGKSLSKAEGCFFLRY